MDRRQVETTAGQAAATKTPAAGTTTAMTSKTIAVAATATTAVMISHSFTDQTSETARSINRASTRGKNAERIRAIRRLTIVSMKSSSRS